MSLRNEVIHMCKITKKTALILVIAILTMNLASCTRKEEPEKNVEIEQEVNNGNLLVKVQSVSETLLNPIKLNVEEVDIKPNIKPYAVNDDFSNIVNLNVMNDRMEDWGEKRLTEEELAKLKENLFFIKEGSEYNTQIYNLYEMNEYASISSFVSTDSILSIFHVLFSATLKQVEENHLYEKLKEFNTGLLEEQMDIKENLKSQNLIDAVDNNIAYLLTGELILNDEINLDVDKRIIEKANSEYYKIDNATGMDMSSLFPTKSLDYSQFKPRGHYTSSPTLEKYFKMMMLYGYFPFNLYDENGNELREETLAAIMMSVSMARNAELLNNWATIYNITSNFVGESDDLTFVDYINAVNNVLGSEFEIESLGTDGFIEDFYKEAYNFPAPQIPIKKVVDDSMTQKNFRIMGQRFLLDAEVMSELMEPMSRPLPSGLDVMAALGSESGKEISINNPENLEMDSYSDTLIEFIKQFEQLDKHVYEKNIYNAWLNNIRLTVQKFGEGYPSFMTTKAWDIKNMNSGLGSYTELKHDTVLYGKQPMAEMGGPEYLKAVVYVEPNVELYENIKGLAIYIKDYVDSLKGYEFKLEFAYDNFFQVMDKVLSASYKELNNEVLTDEEYEELRWIGGLMEGIIIHANKNIEDEEFSWLIPKDMALISDIANADFNGDMIIKKLAIGNPNEIYVVVPIGDELYLTRGSVYNFFEFSDENRYTDEEWVELYNSDSRPERPEWIKGIMVE
ncbi:MAG: DUF3160 domain-containing protein [Tissierellia bacterium]|nr:DUF3160 domain-containing protein [Tissierellia bacterium]